MNIRFGKDPWMEKWTYFGKQNTKEEGKLLLNPSNGLRTSPLMIYEGGIKLLWHFNNINLRTKFVPWEKIETIYISHIESAIRVETFDLKYATSYRKKNEIDTIESLLKMRLRERASEVLKKDTTGNFYYRPHNFLLNLKVTKKTKLSFLK